MCEKAKPSQDYIDKNKDKPKREKKLLDLTIKPSNKPPITQEEWLKLKELTTTDVQYRGIRADTNRKFGVRYALDEDGEVLVQYCPVTKDSELCGVKKREHPKEFSSIALTGQECDLFMQHKFLRGGKYLVITEGEIDALSAYQMLNDYQRQRSSEFETAVVSPTVGANSYRQIANSYKFFELFDNILLAMDNDKAGNDAIENMVKVLPKGRVKILTMRYKDPNEYLQKGKESEFIRDFYDAKPYVPTGVVGSGSLYDAVLDQAMMQRVPFPPFMDDLNLMFRGGLPLGHIINVAAGTGLGKTSFVNEMIYFWIHSSPHLLGIVSLELDQGQYGEALLSRHLSRKISLFGDDDAKMRFLTSPEVKQKATELFLKEDGNHRFYVLDNRDGSVEEIQEAIEELVISCGCRIIVLDPLQDVLDGLSNEEQAVFMKWCKGMIKSHKVTFILINHIRKSASGTANSSNGGQYSEEEIQGSSTIIKSASANILLSRDKYNEDLVVRNTTKVMLSKNRITGMTGPAGEVYYDNETHTLHDKSKFFTDKG